MKLDRAVDILRDEVPFITSSDESCRNLAFGALLLTIAANIADQTKAIEAQTAALKDQTSAVDFIVRGLPR